MKDTVGAGDGGAHAGRDEWGSGRGGCPPHTS